MKEIIFESSIDNSCEKNLLYYQKIQEPVPLVVGLHN
jgi:hypothetical protein